jgi:hypothetical protein
MPSAGSSAARGRTAVLTLLALTIVVPAVQGFSARVTLLFATDRGLRAELSLGDLFPDRFRTLIEDGGTLHIRIRAECWEDRAVWDRLFGPATITTFRLTRRADRPGFTLTDPRGSDTTYDAFVGTVVVRVDLGSAVDVEDTRRYYVRLRVTAGTLPERTTDEVSDAMFGREDETGGLGSVGRFIVRQAMTIGDYLQSETIEATSRTWRGREIKSAGRSTPRP